MSEREERFERMLEGIQENYADTVRRMDALRAEGKTKTVTFRQLMSNKLMYQNMMALYKLYDLYDLYDSEQGEKK